MSSNYRKHPDHCWNPCAFPISEPPRPEIQSAFRAVRNGTNEALTVIQDNPKQVLYPNQQYDLISEYDANTSNFSPAKKGIYSIIASVGFTPDDPAEEDFRVTLSIKVGTDIVASDNEFYDEGTNNIVSVSTNIQLKAGDVVQVLVTSTVTGKILSIPASTHFEATRFPSPTM